MTESNVPIQKERIAPEGDALTPQAERAADGRKLNWQAAGRALRHRNFQLFFSGQLISLTGTWMQSVAQSWLVYKLTGSGLLLGSVGFASQIPVFLVAPIGGITADRMNRQRVVIATQVASMILAFILAALTLTHRITAVAEIFVLAALLGVVNAFDIPGRQSFLVGMVGREELMNAIALNSGMFNAARGIGPAVAGVLVARLGEAMVLLCEWRQLHRRDHRTTADEGEQPAAGDRVVAVGAYKRRFPLRQRRGADSRAAVAAGSGECDRNAVRRADADFCRQNSAQRRPGAGIADRIARSGRCAAGNSDGRGGRGRSSPGALTLAARSGVKGLSRWVATCCAGFGVSLMLFSFSKSFWLSVILLLPVGYFVMLQMASSNTLIQVMVPDELRGRVMSVYSMMFMGLAPLGSLMGGALADRVGAPWAVALGGAVSVLGAVWFGVCKVAADSRRG